MCRSFTIFIRWHRRASPAFTLVEMLAVMGIISLLLVVALPAIKGLNQGLGARGAVGTMMGVLDRTRMMAISDNRATYVVFACPPAGAAALKPDLVGNAYAIYEDHDNISFSPEQQTPWMRLPTNVALKLVDDSGAHPSVTTRFGNGGPTSSDPSFPINGASTASGTPVNVQLPYWKFDGTGAVDEQNVAYLRVLMFIGSVDAGGHEVPLQNAGGASNTTAAKFYEIDVNPATGRAKYILNPQDNLATPTATPAPSP